MNTHDQIPIRVLHVLEADVAKDTSIVDEYIYPTKALDRGLDNLLAVLDRVVVCNSVTTSCLDLLDD